MYQELPAGDNIVILLRNDRHGRLLRELAALFSYSIGRALDSIESTTTAEVRIAITHQLVEPLERARDRLIVSVRRQGLRSERLLLPAQALHMADLQLRALCKAARQHDFPWEDLPDELADPFSTAERLNTALGRRRPPRLAYVAADS